ncbi:MAG: stage V sporulation protein AB [Eubacteriales bacterium]|nr:stage V sporulation protein AB [Eubacteriales bacterium]
MIYLRMTLLSLMGLSAGFVTAAAFVAFIAMLGIFPKIAAKTKTAKECILYENCLIYGILLSTLFQFFVVFDHAGYSSSPLSPQWLGILFLCLLGLFGGIYIGFLIGGLSEVLNVIPIYARKAHIQKWIVFIIFFLAAGKACFSILQFIVIE